MGKKRKRKKKLARVRRKKVKTKGKKKRSREEKKRNKERSIPPPAASSNSRKRRGEERKGVLSLSLVHAVFKRPPARVPLALDLLLLAPLPLEEDGDEVPEVELGPVAAEEEDVRVLVALPQHEVAEPRDPARADEDVQRRVLSRVRVVVQRLRRDRLRVRVLGLVVEEARVC